jgi:hypothetical protein
MVEMMGVDFDKAYSVTGDVMPIKSFATNLIATVTAHFNMALLHNVTRARPRFYLKILPHDSYGPAESETLC